MTARLIVRPLIDTNILSELMRRQPDSGVVAWARRQRGFCVSVVTLEELRFGLTQKHLPMKSQWLDEFLSRHCELLGITPEIALCSGSLRGSFAARGITRHPSDMLIAATALLYRCDLVTRNTDDFADCGLTVINPFSP